MCYYRELNVCWRLYPTNERRILIRSCGIYYNPHPKNDAVKVYNFITSKKEHLFTTLKGYTNFIATSRPTLKESGLQIPTIQISDTQYVVADVSNQSEVDKMATTFKSDSLNKLAQRSDWVQYSGMHNINKVKKF